MDQTSDFHLNLMWTKKAQVAPSDKPTARVSMQNTFCVFGLENYDPEFYLLTQQGDIRENYKKTISKSLNKTHLEQSRSFFAPSMNKGKSVSREAGVKFMKPDSRS